MKLEFFGLVLILNIVNSKADIPNCKYFDTIDISQSERKQNDFYDYDGMNISAALTGEYSYILGPRSFNRSVKPHLRACVCNQWPCVRFCCLRKNLLANGECDDGLKEEIAKADPFLYVRSADLKLTTPYHLKELFIIRERFWACDELINLRDDQYILFKDGGIYIPSSREFLDRANYCFYPTRIDSNFSKSIWIVHHRCSKGWPPALRELMVISLICFLLTIAVYLYVKKLLNAIGKCLVCSIFCGFLMYLTMVLDDFSLLKNICYVAGYSSYYFKMAFNLWESVISYKLFQLIVWNNPDSSFVAYNIFVWGIAAIPTGVIFVLNKMWDWDLGKWNWLPLVGFDKCEVKGGNSTNWLYYYGPFLIIHTFNLITFSRTVIYICKVRSKLSNFNDRRERTNNSNKQLYGQALRLFIIMGVFWMLEIIPHGMQDYHVFWEWVMLIVMYINGSIGILTFVLLILKKTTLKMIMERIRE